MPRLAPALYALAIEHDGLFTAAEAAAGGVSYEALTMAARRGAIQRLSRGIYRLTAFPADEERVQLWEAALWPATHRGPDPAWGVISHLSALRIHYALLDYIPAKVSITIAPDHRIRRKPPAWLDVHRAELPADDVTNVGGPPLTTLPRTLHDCIDAGVERRLIAHVLDWRERELPAVMRDAAGDAAIAAVRARLA